MSKLGKIIPTIIELTELTIIFIITIIILNNVKPTTRIVSALLTYYTGLSIMTYYSITGNVIRKNTFKEILVEDLMYSFAYFIILFSYKHEASVVVGTMLIMMTTLFSDVSIEYTSKIL